MCIYVINIYSPFIPLFIHTHNLFVLVVGICKLLNVGWLIGRFVRSLLLIVPITYSDNGNRC